MDEKVYLLSNMEELLKAWHSGQKCRITRTVYEYYLEVLPPIYINRRVKVDGKERLVDFGFAEGAEHITAFWTEGLNYYLQQTTEMNPRA
jgi:hypothetical protein